MKRLLLLLKPYKKRLVAVAALDALGVIFALLMPYVMSEIVDGGIAKENMRSIVIYSLVMLLLALLSVGCSLLANKINSAITTGYTKDLCYTTFERINSLSYAEYSKIGPSGLLTRATDDIFNIEGAASNIVYTLVTVPIMVIGAVALSFMKDAVLASIFLISIPPVLLIILLLMRPLYSMWDRSDKYIDLQNRIVRERLSGIRVVRAFGNEKKEHKRAKFATEEMAKYMIKANVRGDLIEPIAMLLFNLATVAVVIFAGARAEAGLARGAGDVIAIIQYFALLSGALLNLSWSLAWMPRVRVSVKRMNEIFASSPERISDRAQEIDCADIRLRNLSFTYPDGREPVLKNLSLEIKEGDRVAIIGGTGSGKTTLVRLLCALFTPTEGEILLGEKSYGELDLKSIRAVFSVALQRASIFEGTVRDNVKMGNPDATDEEITQALEDCQMKDFLLSHSEGLDYLLVGMGTNVSGGQKQRINLARTALKKARVYIFDDSFSALDYLTEKTIRENLEKRIGGSTVITVTQRASTAMAADLIYVMDGGKIVGKGTHKELLGSSDIYREICLTQLGKDALGGKVND